MREKIRIRKDSGMNIKIERDRMFITPENEAEKVYLEVVFKLKSDGDSVKATRRDKYQIGGFLHLEIK